MVLARGDRRAGAAEAGERLELPRQERLLEPAQLEVAHLVEQGARVRLVESHVAVDGEEAVASELTAPAAQVLEVVAQAVLARGGTVGQAHLRTAEARALVDIRPGPSGIELDARRGARREQLEHRHSGVLAAQVPEREVDSGDRRQDNAARAVRG